MKGLTLFVPAWHIVLAMATWDALLRLYFNTTYTPFLVNFYYDTIIIYYDTIILFLLRHNYRLLRHNYPFFVEVIIVLLNKYLKVLIGIFFNPTEHQILSFCAGHYVFTDVNSLIVMPDWRKWHLQCWYFVMEKISAHKIKDLC